MRSFIIGFAAAIVLTALVAAVAVETGAIPARGDIKPGALEKWASRTSLKATIAREEPQPPYPGNPPSTSDLVSGATLYVQNCAVCHSTARGTPSSIARGFAITVPRLAKHPVDDDPEGETYWKIKHGIRFTGMPAFGKTLDENAIWQLTYFLKHMKKLPPQAQAIFDNPKLAPPATPLPEPSMHA